MKRFLMPKDIPNSLWDGDNLLRLPIPLKIAYVETLTTNGLLEEALKVSSEASVGGESVEETDLHFARKFDGSCARVELAVLDPKEELRNASDYFIRAFSGGQIRLLDIPCGCGAASAALLTTVAELRRQRVLPREPLDVAIIGGDISDNARRYADCVFDALKKELRSQGIFVKVALYPWDVLDDASTTDLVDKWLRDQDCERFFLLISNFSGFLNNEGKIKKAREQLRQVINWAGTRRSTIAWIEPPTRQAKRLPLNQILKGIFDKLKFWSYEPAESSERYISEAKFADPVCSERVHNVRLLLYQMEEPT